MLLLENSIDLNTSSGILCFFSMIAITGFADGDQGPLTGRSGFLIPCGLPDDVCSYPSQRQLHYIMPNILQALQVARQAKKGAKMRSKTRGALAFIQEKKIAV